MRLWGLDCCPSRGTQSLRLSDNIFAESCYLALISGFARVSSAYSTAGVNR